MRDRPRRRNCSSGSGGCKWSWSGSKTSLCSSDTRKLLKPSIATTQESASAGTVCFLACLAPRSTSSRNRCGNRRRGSWPGSILSSCMTSVVDQVWATDITYIPLEKGFLYLVAIVDLFTRNVLAGSSRAALTRSSVWRLWRWL